MTPATKPAKKNTRRELQRGCSPKGRGVVLDTVEGSILTTGAIAKLCGVAPRTAAKWCDSGQLKSYRIPLSNDRRVLAKDLHDFLAGHKCHIPSDLAIMVDGRSRVILFRCPKMAIPEDVADVHVTESLWKLAELATYRGHVTLVCGSGSLLSEIVDIFSQVPSTWLKIHVRGPDQARADGSDHAFEEAGNLADLIAATIIRTRSV